MHRNSTIAPPRRGVNSQALNRTPGRQGPSLAVLLAAFLATAMGVAFVDAFLAEVGS